MLKKYLFPSKNLFSRGSLNSNKYGVFFEIDDYYFP